MRTCAIYQGISAPLILNLAKLDPSVEDYARYVTKGSPFWVVDVPSVEKWVNESNGLWDAYILDEESLGSPSGEGIYVQD